MIGALMLWAVTAVAPEPPASARAPSSEVVVTAALIARAAPELAGIWPGYWPSDQAFVLYERPSGALLVSPPGAKPDGFAALRPSSLPPELQGRAFHRLGELADVRAPFVLGYPLEGGQTAVLVTTMAGKPRETAHLALHEQFHAFQQKAFKRAGGSQFIDPAAIGDRVAFAAAAEVERRVLAAAVAVRTDAEAKTLLRQYLALRREREATAPASLALVERDFERLEGTARYVDRVAGSIVYGGGAAGVRKALLDELGEDLGARTGPYLNTWFRTRSYAVGGGISYCLNRLEPGWRTQVEGGAGLDEILASTVGFEPGPGARTLARQGRVRFGYEQRRRELAPAVQRVSAGEITTLDQFHALAPYRVTVTYVVPKVDGRSAVRLGLSSRSMAQLSPSRMVLPAPEVVSGTMPFGALTVSKHPFMRDGSGNTESLVALLPSAPEVVGRTLAQGEHRLRGVELKAAGYELKIDAPVVVRVESTGMTVSLVQAPEG